MWMDSLLQDALVRDRIGEMQRRAARRRLLRGAKPSRASRLPWAPFWRLKRRIERMAFP
jgi:hypothetical protein